MIKLNDVIINVINKWKYDFIITNFNFMSHLFRHLCAKLSTKKPVNGSSKNIVKRFFKTSKYRHEGSFMLLLYFFNLSKKTYDERI